MLLFLFEINRFKTVFFTSSNAFYFQNLTMSPRLSPTPKMRRREAFCAAAPKLSPAESKWTSNSFRCALARGADIRPSAGAFPASPRAGAIRVYFYYYLGPVMALPSRHGASHVPVDLQNTKPFGPPVGPGDAPGVRNGALASARCTFYLKMMLPPPRGAHLPHLASLEHHLGSSNLSSR